MSPNGVDTFEGLDFSARIVRFGLCCWERNGLFVGLWRVIFGSAFAFGLQGEERGAGVYRSKPGSVSLLFACFVQDGLLLFESGGSELE